MPANQYGFNLAEVYSDAERIKGARMGNELNRLKLDEHKAGKERNALLQPIRAKAVQGDTDAQQQVMMLDPKNGPLFVKQVQEANKGKREQMAANIEQYGSQSASILQAMEQDPSAAMGAYKEWYKNAPPEFRKTMPTTNIKSWLELSVAKAQAADNLLAEYKTLDHGGESLLVKGSQIKERTKKPKTPAQLKSEKSGDLQALKTGGSIIARVLGGKWTLNDQTGETEYIGLDDSGNRKALAAHVRMVEIMEQSGTNPAAAAKQALEELGMDFPAPDTGAKAPPPLTPGPSAQRTPKSRYTVDPATGQIVELK